VRSVLDTECLALVPKLINTTRKNHKSTRRALPAPDLAGRPRSITLDPRILRTVIEAPSSPYAEAVRSLKLTVDLNRNSKGKYSKVIGLTSCLPGEGKSTLAAAMAALMANGGSNVLLVDCDLRNPSLSRTLTPDAPVGFLDVVAGEVPLSDALWTDPTTKMSFLPMVPNGRLPNPTEMLCSPAAKSLFNALELRYDYVVVDLAPLIAAIDARAAARLIDSYVLVIEWGRTERDTITQALRDAPMLHDQIIGTVLNKANIDVLNRYDVHRGNYYYNSYYHRYGYID